MNHLLLCTNICYTKGLEKYPIKWILSLYNIPHGGLFIHLLRFSICILNVNSHLNCIMHSHHDLLFHLRHLTNRLVYEVL